MKKYNSWELADKLRWNTARNVPVKFFIITPDDKQVVELNIEQIMFGDEHGGEIVIQMKTKD